MQTQRAIAVYATTCVLLTLASCGSAAAPEVYKSALGDKAITVASFNFPESRLLASIYGLALRAGGYQVHLELGLGSREFVEPALARGLVEFVPEYAGTALQFLSRNRETPTADAAANHAALVRTLRSTDIEVLAASDARDANAIVVTRRTVEQFARHHIALRDLSDLRALAPRLTFAGPPECPTRPFCLQGLKKKYGIAFKAFVPTDAGGPLTLQALRTGLVDVGLLFTTDPNLSTGRFVVLTDDKDLQPAESVTPLVHREVVRRWGRRVQRLVDDVSRRLSSSQLRRLNRKVVIDDRQPERVAAQWLQAEGLR